MRIAVLPVGYYEGYVRRLSNIGHALINAVRAGVWANLHEYGHG